MAPSDGEPSQRSPKHFLPVDAFYPEDGQAGSAAVGTRALSSYLGADGISRWQPCDVVGFESADNTYTVRWVGADAPLGTKRVQRLNLRLAGEELGGPMEKR